MRRGVAGAKIIYAGRRCLAHTESAPAEGTGQAGTGAGCWGSPDGLCERAEAHRASMVVHYA
jgi:hypothetical protein